LCAHYVTSTDGRRLREACASLFHAEGTNVVSRTVASPPDRAEHGR
jgi:hypothetical protein